MTGRDRIVVIGIVVFVAARRRLDAGRLARAQAGCDAGCAGQRGERAARHRRQPGRERAQRADAVPEAYASIVRLGKAVPPSEEVPSLIYQIAHATNAEERRIHLDHRRWKWGVEHARGAAAAPPHPPPPRGFTQMPFTFVFNGSFADLYHLFQQLDSATVHTTSGLLVVSGRLLTIQSVKLAPSTPPH